MSEQQNGTNNLNNGSKDEPKEQTQSINDHSTTDSTDESLPEEEKNIEQASSLSDAEKEQQNLADQSDESTDLNQDSDEQKKKKKTGIIIGGIVAVAAIILILVFLVLPGIQTDGSIQDEIYPNRLALQDDSTLAIVFAGGSVKTVDGTSIKNATISSNGKSVAFLEESGSLYTVDTETLEKTKALEDVASLDSILLNRYLMYTQPDASTSAKELDVDTILQEIVDYYEIVNPEYELDLDFVRSFFDERYDDTLEDALLFYEQEMGFPFDEDAIVPMDIVYLYDMDSKDTTEVFNPAESSYNQEFEYNKSALDTQFSYINTEGEVMLIQSDGSAKVMGELRNNVSGSLSTTPNQGDLVVWYTTNDDDDSSKEEVAVYAHLNENEEKIFTFESYFSFLTSLYNDNGSEMLLSSMFEEDVYYLNTKGDIEKIKVDGDEIDRVIANNDRIYGESDTLEPFFVVTSDSDYAQKLYLMNLDGDKDRITSKLLSSWSVSARGSSFIYIDEDGGLYLQQFSGNKLSEDTKISSDVAWAQLSEDSSIVWYAKKDGDDWILYRYQNNDSEKISDDVLPSSVYLTSDGKTATYIKNGEILKGDELEDYPRMQGDLYLYKDGKAEKLASDAYASSLFSPLRGASIDATNIQFIANIYTKDDQIFGDLYLYNGKEKMELLSDICFDELGINVGIQDEYEELEIPAVEPPAEEPVAEEPAAEEPVAEEPAAEPAGTLVPKY